MDKLGLGFLRMKGRKCMNELCGASLAASNDDGVKKGWGLRSGHFANLCAKCG